MNNLKKQFIPTEQTSSHSATNDLNGSGIISGVGKYFQERRNLVFVVVPLMLFVLMLFRVAEIHFYFQGWYDPVYAYLTNGLTFALGSNDIGHTDHPGTPLQLFIALLITIIGWIRGANDLATDVLANPETYLRIITIALIAINCTMLWMLGVFANKRLQNRNMAVVLQLLPLLSFQLFNFMAVINCESVISLSSFAIAACIILYDWRREEGHMKFLIIIAILSALSVATKISSLSILIVPFFFFENIRSKAIYLLLSLLFIFLFIFPVMDKLGNFTGFIGKLATHTGQYGSGEQKLFDATIFFQSIRMMVLKELPFTLHLLLLPVGWFVIVKRKITGSLKRLFLGITLATVFQVIIVARHYGFHYLMPVFALFMPLHGYFWIQFFREKIATLSSRTFSLMMILLVLGVFARLIIRNNFDKGITNSVEKTSQMVKSELKGKYIVLSDFNNGAAFIEPALKFGYSYSGNSMKKRYAEILASVYPENYLWNIRDGFTNWTGSYLSTDIFSMNDQIFIYANTGNCEVSMRKISEMIDLAGISGFVNLKNVCQNEKRGEVIALAIVDTAMIRKHSQPKLMIETSMEGLSEDGELIKSSVEEYSFRGGQLRTNQFARSGNSSILLTTANQFGLNISIPVSQGKRFKVEFWQRSSDQKQTLVVASATKSDVFYKTSFQGENNSGEWTRSELNVTLPENYPDANLQFYLWSPASDSVWVDDFRLTVFE
ncbi:MAG: hypothetical protein Q8P34_16190 [Bacteroidota bacterium]|nr:hypothetical protein [Bacteroidota bacterium]